MKTVVFNAEYYNRIIREFRYNPVEFEQIDFTLGRWSRDDIQQQWLCHVNGKAFANAHKQDKRVIATTGFGLSGVPHIGTISQILRAIRLQQNGVPVQIVLGDLDAYNGKGISLSYTQQLVQRYKAFILSLGFNDSNPSILRSQYNTLETLRLSYLLGCFMDDDMFVDTEEDLHQFYSKNNKVDDQMTYRRKLSLNLMVADFISLHTQQKFNYVLVFLGIDEHKYVKFAIETINKIKTSNESFLDGFVFSAMYSSIIRGFYGYPKMSKSFPQSSINVDMTAAEIAEQITNGEGEFNCPENNVVYQMIASASLFSAEEISEAYTACLQSSIKWRQIKSKYAEHLFQICNQW